MAQKPEIQYIGQFYVYGSEAKAMEAERKQKPEKAALPEPVYQPRKKVRVDLLAIGSLLLAAVFIATMAFGLMSLESAWQELETAQQYVYELNNVNRRLTIRYEKNLDMDYIQSVANNLGLIPIEEITVRPLQVNLPQPKPQRTLWEDLRWYLDCLF